MQARNWRVLLMMAMVPFAQAASAQEQAPALKCETGPVTRSYGDTDWLVYSCDDKHSLVVITAPGNPATPFYFMYHHSAKGYELYGEGTGDKQITDRAYGELKALTEDQLASLLAATQKTAAQ